jgi:hypothetical protein
MDCDGILSADDVGSVVGIARLLNDSSVGGISVSLGDMTTMTDGTGLFRFDNAPLGSAFVRAEYEGFTTGMKRVEVQEVQTTTTEMALMRTRTGSFPADLGGTVTLNDWSPETGPFTALSIVFPPESVAREDGTPFSGIVYVQAAMINTPDEVDAAPGNMTAVDPEDPESTIALESFGMFDAQLTSRSGEALVLVTDADISFPPYGTHDIGDSIGLYSFDEDSGLWVNEGSGIIDVDGNFVASVSHFSWWNADEPLSLTSCLEGVAIGEDGTLMTGGNLRTVGIDYMGYADGQIESDGSFCVNAKPESENTIKLMSLTDGAAWSGQMTATSGTGGMACSDEVGAPIGIGDCVDVGTLELTEMPSGCISGRFTGEDFASDGVVTYYFATGDVRYTGSFEIEDDNTFCLTVPPDTMSIGLGINPSGTTTTDCAGGIFIEYFAECYTEIDTGIIDTGPWVDTGIIDTGPWVDTGTCISEEPVALGEGSCEVGDCVDIGDIDVFCEPGEGDGELPLPGEW